MSDEYDRMARRWTAGIGGQNLTFQLEAQTRARQKIEEVRRAAIKECIETLWGRVGREEHHAKAAVALDIEALHALLDEEARDAD